jgi:hypothetical protein
MKRFYNREKNKRIFVFQRITQSYTRLVYDNILFVTMFEFCKKKTNQSVS